MKYLISFALMVLATIVGLIIFSCINEDEEDLGDHLVQEILSDDQLRDRYSIWHEQKH